MTHKRHYLAASIILASSTLAHAQIEEVIVTAQHRQESSMEVPVAITAMNEAILESRGITELTDVGLVTPGLISTEGASAFSPYIRGVGSRNVTPGNESPVANYVDGVYQYDPIGMNMTGFSDVQSLEVLRGPQGTLFGRNATGGAIRVTTKGPSHEFGGHIELTQGSDGHGVSGFITGGITDSLSASLSAYEEQQDAYIRNLNPANGAGSKTGESDNKGFRAKVLWEPTDTFSALFAATHLNLMDRSKTAMQPIEGSPLSAAEAAGLTPVVRGQKRSFASEARPLTYNDKEEYSLTMDLDVGQHVLTSITAYTEIEGGVRLDVDASPAPMLGIDNNYSSRAFQQEFRIVSDYDGAFNWLAGAYYYDTTAGYDRDGGLRLAIGHPIPSTPASHAAWPTADAMTQVHWASVDIESVAVYGEGSYDLTDTTSLTLGLRYTEDKHDLHDDNRREIWVNDGAGNVDLLAPPLYASDECAAAAGCSGTDETFREATWRIVLNHYFNDDFMGYASYNRGFKSGAYVLSTAHAWQPTEPELLDAYEIGFKGYAFDRNVQYNGALYYYDYQDLQQALTDPETATARVINAANATSSGFELDVTWSVNDNLTLQSGFAYLFEAEYDDFDNCEVYTGGGAGGTPAVVTTDCGGTDIIVSPDYTIYLAANYNMMLESGAELSLGGVVDYTDEYQYLPEPKDSSIPVLQPRQKSMETVNLYAQWTAPQEAYYVKLWGNNLTGSDRLMGISSTGVGTIGQYGRDATYGVTVGVNF